MAQQKTQPHKIRLGHIRAVIWPNKSDARTWYAVTFDRSYKDGQEWKETTSFNREDLPIVAVAAVMAYYWIWKRTATESNPQDTEI